MEKKSIYTTGITGFIGKNFLPILLKNYDQVINFSRRDTIHVISKDHEVEKKPTNNFFLNNPSKELINLATLYLPEPGSISDMRSLVEANILFPIKVIDKLKLFKKLKVINALSYTQLLKLENQNIYSLTKEIFKKFLSKRKNSNIVNLYIFDTFGSKDRRNKVTDQFIRSVLQGNEITISKNTVKINLSHSSAVSLSLLKSLSLDSGSYCIRSPDTISLEDLAYLIMNIIGKEVKINKINNNSVSHYELIDSFPKNIFHSPKGYNLKKGLESRIKEISR